MRRLSFPLLAAAAALALVALLAAGTASAQYVANPALMPQMQMIQMDEQQPFTIMAAGRTANRQRTEAEAEEITMQRLRPPRLMPQALIQLTRRSPVITLLLSSLPSFLFAV